MCSNTKSSASASVTILSVWCQYTYDMHPSILISHFLSRHHFCMPLVVSENFCHSKHVTKKFCSALAFLGAKASSLPCKGLANITFHRDWNQWFIQVKNIQVFSLVSNLFWRDFELKYPCFKFLLYWYLGIEHIVTLFSETDGDVTVFWWKLNVIHKK